MSNAKSETIVDIVREMRTLGRLDEKSTDKIPRRLQALGLRTYADRIEAAATREREAGAEAAQICGEVGEMIGREAERRSDERTAEKYSAVGNATAMRKALLETQSVIARCIEILDKIPGGVEYDGLIDDVADEICDLRESHVNPALAAPPRNCDVGTVDEQLKRFSAFCMSRKCNECPFVSSTYGECGVRWSQMPYEGGVG